LKTTGFKDFSFNQLYLLTINLLEAGCKFSLKLKSVDELKQALQVIWDNLPLGKINKL